MGATERHHPLSAPFRPATFSRAVGGGTALRDTYPGNNLQLLSLAAKGSTGYRDVHVSWLRFGLNRCCTKDC